MKDNFKLLTIRCMDVFFSMLILLFSVAIGIAQELDREGAAAYIEPPYQLGKSFGIGGWELINLDGRVAGYAFETLPLAPLPGFGGAPINLFVSVTIEGRFINAEIISHNEPIFVSGLDEALFHNFVTQYNGHSITDTLVVGVPYGNKGAGSSLIYLKGVTKATASVRIAHETILAAAFKIARDKLGIAGSIQKVRPNLEYKERLNWNDLVEKGLAKRKLITNADAQNAFAGTLWQDDDPAGNKNPQDPFLDLWVVDIGVPAIAKAVLTPNSVETLRKFQEISDNDEPILLIDNGRHGLVSKDFVRNTSPDLISLKQGGLPIALRDSDLEFELLKGVPGNSAMIIRTDRRLGFDPTSDWNLTIRAVREHGSFRPEIGTQDFTVTHKTDIKFYNIEEKYIPLAPWKQAGLQRLPDLAGVSLGIGLLFWLLFSKMSWLASLKNYTPVRLSILAFVIVFIGWWGQGQLSIATALGVVRGLLDGQSLSFLLYDPFSLLIWMVVIVSFFIWGRGLFCGWLCPFGAMQEFAHHIGRILKLPQLEVPEALDRIFSKLKYVVLAAMVGALFFAPGLNDKLIEIEPFKTAVTTFFVREWYYVAYAVGLLLISMVLFKGFCRYLCPLGAFMAIGGLFRLNDWIERRAECGSPCQLCKVKCNYNAIKKTGEIKYSECFQCLDCVTIFDDDKKCVPLILQTKGRAR
ncbi:MAG: 4Fe-4S binding protein [Rhizobiales bacterium]|nr:4Fe-4S binding protein [Hyphomicrobiales bacterium]